MWCPCKHNVPILIHFELGITTKAASRWICHDWNSWRIFFVEASAFCMLGSSVGDPETHGRIIHCEFYSSRTFSAKNYIILQYHAIFVFFFTLCCSFSPGFTTIYFPLTLHFYNFIFVMPVSFFTFSTLSGLYSRGISTNSAFDLVYMYVVVWCYNLQCTKRKLQSHYRDFYWRTARVCVCTSGYFNDCNGIKAK